MQDSSSEACSLSRTEFLVLASVAAGHRSREEYGLLFDADVVSQQTVRLLGKDGVKACGRVSWRGLSSFLPLKLSDTLWNNRAISAPCWKASRTLTCPHRETIQKVKGLSISLEVEFVTMT